jgi:hypothetical protein
MNIILFRSSILCTLIHNIFIIKYFPIYNNTFLLLLYIGMYTSIINHANNNKYLQIIDRIVMHIGILYNKYLLYKLELYYDLILLNICGYLYLLSRFIKYKNNIRKNIHEIPHVLSHLLLTYIHIKILYIYNEYYTLETCDANP